MSTGHSRFVVRCRLRGNFGQWFQIEHVQSGRSIQVAVLGKAEAWIRARSRPLVEQLPVREGPRRAVGHSSFLVRCWSRGNFEPRFVIEHTQSGRSIQIGSLDAAENWVCAQLESVERDISPAVLPVAVASQEWRQPGHTRPVLPLPSGA